MPELSKDFFANALAKAFFPREWPEDQVDPPFYGWSSLENKSGHESQKFVLTTPNSFHNLVADPEPPYVDVASPCGLPSFLSVDCDGNQINQVLGEYPSSYGLPNYPSLNLDTPLLQQLVVPEIDDPSWMTDVLDDLPAIQEFSTLGCPVPNVPLNMIPCLDYPSPSSLPMPLTPLPALTDSPIAGPAPTPSSKRPPAPPMARSIKKGASITKALSPEESPCVSPTPKPLKPRSRRSPKGVDKPKKSVCDVEAGHGRKQRREDTTLKISSIESLLATAAGPGPKLEHVRRERQRRDDMSFKISTLECLLPPAGPNMKRDRASIVHDSVHYVKSLQAEVEELKRVFAELQTEKSSRSFPRADGSKATNLEKEPCPSKKTELVEYLLHVEGSGDSAARIEKCRCRSDYMSSSMKVLEQFNLDLCRGTVTKMFDYTVCVIVAKPRLTSSKPAALSTILAKLRAAVEIS